MAASARTISISLLSASAGAPGQGASGVTMVKLCPITLTNRHRIGPAAAGSRDPRLGLEPERFVAGGRIDAVLEPPPAEEADVLVEALVARASRRAAM